jgi:glutamate 5-kinase
MAELNNKIVVRIEISTLCDENGKLNLSKMERLAMIVSNLHNSGKKLLLVSSGAIALGSEKLGIPIQTSDVTMMQAAAAIGQAELIKMYQKFFNEYQQNVAQVLITSKVMENPIRSQNARNTFNTLLDLNVIPIINENDVVSTSDIELDDNYPLAVNVANLSNANTILIITNKSEKYLIIERNKPIAQLVESESELFNKLNTISNASVDDGSNVTFPCSLAEVI